MNTCTCVPQPGFNTAAEGVSPKLEVGDAIKRYVSLA